MQSLKSPNALLTAQFFASGAVLGLTNATSLIRLAAVPVNAGLAWLVMTGGPHRGGLTFAMFMQYLDLALFKRWSYSPNAGHLVRDGIAHSRGAAEARDGQPDPPPQPASTLYRFWLGLCAMLSFRRVNTADEVKGTPAEIPGSRLQFCLRAFALQVVTNIGTDVCAWMRDSAKLHYGFTDSQRFLFSHAIASGGVSFRDLGFRTASTFGWFLSIYCVFTQTMTLASILPVGLGLSGSKDWRPLFGSPAKAYTLRGMWGDFWHQLLRGPMGGFSDFFTHEVLRVSRTEKSTFWRYFKMGLVFALSGLLHFFLQKSLGVGWRESGVMRCFMMQWIGIMVEDRVQKRFTGSWWRNSWVSYPIGYAWVVLFLVWTTPTWSFPEIQRLQGPILKDSLVQIVTRRQQSLI